MNITSIFPFLAFNWSDIIFYLFWAFIFFMVLREGLTWYWKINKITDLLEKIEKNTAEKSGQEHIDKSTKIS